MPKTQKEIQKEYRARKKLKDGEDVFNKREADRKRKAYIPASELPPDKLKKRNNDKQKSNRASRKRKKDKLTEFVDVASNIQVDNNPVDGPCDSTNVVDDSQIAGTSTRKQWKLRTKISRGLSPVKSPDRKEIRRRNQYAAKVKTDSLEKSKSELHKKLKTSQKANQRLKLFKASVLLNDISTPEKQATETLRDSGISPSKTPALYDTLLVQNVVIKELQEATKEKENTDMSIHNVLTGDYAKKTRKISKVSKLFSIDRRTLMASKTKLLSAKKKRCREVFKQRAKKAAIAKFVTRDDISSCLPGKRDGKLVRQKRVLNDFVYHLHAKYISEGNIKVSVTYFHDAIRQMPDILHVKHAKLRTCLCQKHENFRLKLAGLRKAGVDAPKNPDSIAEEDFMSNVVTGLKECKSDTITFEEWKNVGYNHNGKPTTRLDRVEITATKDEFKTHFEKEAESFKVHSFRAKEQYRQVCNLRDNLPENHCTVQVDFAENYACHYRDESQGAYYSKIQLTIHPAVMHYTSTENNVNKLMHKSFVFTSDVNKHNTAMIYTIVDKLISHIRETLPTVNYIHYISDSPFNQYRNKTIMYLVSSHKDRYGISASWQFFESGHGKGPCDGVGGVSKRMADLAVIRGENIHSSSQFNLWANTELKPLYIEVERCEYDKKVEEVASLDNKLNPIPGTKDIHSVFTDTTGKIISRDSSCFCNSCWKEGQLNITSSCGRWNVASVLKGTPRVKNVTGKGASSVKKRAKKTQAGKREPIKKPTETTTINNDDSAIPNKSGCVEKPVPKMSEITPNDSMEVAKSADVEKTLEKTAEVIVENSVVADKSGCFDKTVEKTVEKIDNKPKEVEPLSESVSSVVIGSSTETDDQSGTHEKKTFVTDDFVLATFDKKHYIGRVIDTDETDTDLPLQITFMEKSKTYKLQFKWPSKSKQDIIWMSAADVLCKITEPVLERRGLYRLDEDTLPIDIGDLIFG